MNRQQLRTMLWMRWRILVNSARKASKLSNALIGGLLAISLLIAAALFIWALVAGIEELPKIETKYVLWLWLGLALVFCFFWLIGLVTELKRSDSMSFKNLLHLPISLNWVFFYNYLSSFVSLSILLFLPPMLGLWLAFVIVHGPVMLLGLPLVLGFFAMITALTYQLRGWLARLMEDKRRGRAIVMGITFLLVLLIQTPNIINLSTRGSASEARQQRSELMWKMNNHDDAEVQAEAQAQWEELKAQDAALEAKINRYLTTGSAIVPIGWLPYGMSATFAGRWWWGVLCTMGMFGIAGLSLRRAYRKTVQGVVQGGAASDTAGSSSAQFPQPAADVDSAADVDPVGLGAQSKQETGRKKPPLVERKLPFVHEQSSAVATLALQSLLRAPEGKLLLLSPIILLGLFAFMMASKSNPESSQTIAPAMSLGAAAMGLVSLNQLLQNQFGLDRDGVRAYLLSPIPRDRILLGKNLSLAPIALPIEFIGLLILQFFVGLDLQHFLGACLQLVSAFLIMCLLGNYISTSAPLRLKEVGMQAANAKFRTILLQIMSLFLVPLSLAPLLFPWGAEVMLSRYTWSQWVPIYLILHALVLAAVGMMYQAILQAQGQMFAKREQEVLKALTEG